MSHVHVLPCRYFFLICNNARVASCVCTSCGLYTFVFKVSSVERQQVLQAIERLQLKLGQQQEWTHSERLGALRDALQKPLLGHILTLQHSVKQLRDQVRMCNKVKQHSEILF